ncbi:MAG: aminotransferase class V-fold PLP-dependent enzyme [Acidobacteria bacterium]|nr:aminotransferase class V-fold PLP-dependent enzyme [Candidatus Sulfomarinibacter kjeldsenii]
MLPDFGALRRQFPTLDNWVYLDTAAKAPLPKCAEEAMISYMADMWEQVGERAFSIQEIERARETLARLVGVSPSTVSFLKNTSEGINIVAHGLGLEAGDKVLISEFEHSACVLPWRRLEKIGVEVVVVRGSDGRIPPESFIEKMDDRTRAVGVSWVAYGNGYRFDIPAIAAACRERDIVLAVDGIQAIGVLATPLTELGADVVVAGGFKGLLSPTGTGFLYCREGFASRIEPAYVARFSFESDDKWQQPLRLATDSSRFEYGNPNYLGIWVMRHSVELILDIGLDQIERRVEDLTTYLYERVEDRGFKVVTPKPWHERAGILSFDVPEPEMVRQQLLDRRIVVNVRDGNTLRVAPHFYNTRQDIDTLVGALVELAL